MRQLPIPIRSLANMTFALCFGLLIISCQKTDGPSDRREPAGASEETGTVHEPLKTIIDVRKLAGISPAGAEDLLGSPFETYETHYTHPSWEPLKSIPSVSRLYSINELEVKLRFIEGGARWISVYFISEKPKTIMNAFEMTGLDYYSPDTRSRLYAEWHGLGGFYEVRAFPHDTWEQGVSYILIITTTEYR